MESNEKLRKDWDNVQQSSEKLQESSARHEERLRSFTSALSSSSSTTATRLRDWRDRAEQHLAEAKQKFNERTETNESLKNTVHFVQRTVEHGAEKSSVAFAKVKGVAS